ncbi:MAG TPA: ATP-binding protein [Myxococcota bacterium]|nr:ATP-binding protein [Myxococcota bacterium]
MIIPDSRTRRFANLLQLDPDRWREQLLGVLLRFAVVLGTIVCIPSVYLALLDELYGLALVDVLGLAVVYALRFARGVPFRVRALVFSFAFYGIGAALLLSVGPIAQIYLLGSSLTATFLLGHRAGFAVAAINAATLMVAGVSQMAAPGFFAPAFHGDPANADAWIVVALNFCFINISLVAIASSVVSTVLAGFDREARARLSLQHSQALLSMALRVGRFDAWSTTLPELRLSWAEIARGVETFDGSRMASLALACQACLPADGEALRAAFDRCLERGVPFDLEVRLLREAGQGGALGTPAACADDQWLRWMGEARRDDDGRIVGARGALQDISAQKRLELQLRERERRSAEQAELLDKAQDAIVVLDLMGHASYLNRRARELYGIDPQASAGADLRRHLASDLEDYDRGLAIALSEGAHLSEHRLAGPTAPLIVERRWTRLTNDDGVAYGVMIIDTDVTGQRELQEQLIRSQRLESIGTLASGIAHDLNNVLTPVLMAVDMLRATETDPERLGDLETISSSTQRASDMVRQILGFARGFKGERAPFDVGQVLGDLARMMRETFPKSIAARVARTENLSLIGDATQVTQVLVNLCVNARDAMPEGGELVVEVDRVDLDIEHARHIASARAGAFVRFRVRDSGLGMDAATLARIYEPFFTTKEVGRGTGLGLFTTHAIVAAHLGFITVESAPGAGTTFEVYLPLDPRAQAQPAQATANAKPGRGERVLLVEDEDTLRVMARRLLEQAGYSVEVAAHGAEALALLDAAGPSFDGFDLIVTDVNMPVMDGAALIRTLRERGARSKLVAVSGLPTAAIEGLVDATLSKPYTPQAMLSVVREVLDAGVTPERSPRRGSGSSEGRDP